MVSLRSLTGRPLLMIVFFLSWYLGVGASQHLVGKSGQLIGQLAGSQPAQLVEKGEALAAQGRFAEAEVLLKEAQQLLPHDENLLVLLGKVEARLGKREEAVTIFRSLVKDKPLKADAHVNLAIALADTDELEDALKEATTAVTLSNLPSAHLNRARILADLHRPEEAEKEFAIANRLAPNDPNCLYYWALLEKDRGYLAKQISLLQDLIRLDPDNLKYLLLLAAGLQQESKDIEAVAVLRHALQIEPTSEKALYMLSMELRGTDPKESKRLQLKYEDERNKSASLTVIKSLGNQANEAAKRQDWSEAIELLKKALEGCGDCEIVAALHKNLGLALCRSGNPDEGKKELGKALKLDPNDPDIVKALSITPK